jgi:hypothetical protein
VSREEHGERLEMLLVMRWLDAGAPDDGVVALPVSAAAGELGLGPDREGLLAVMAALGELEDRRVIEVSWPGGAGAGEAHVTLSEGLRRDARRLFGRA